MKRLKSLKYKKMKNYIIKKIRREKKRYLDLDLLVLLVLCKGKVESYKYKWKKYNRQNFASLSICSDATKAMSSSFVHSIGACFATIKQLVKGLKT